MSTATSKSPASGARRASDHAYTRGRVISPWILEVAVVFVSTVLERAAENARFRYESDMLPVLTRSLTDLTFGRTTAAEAQVFLEVPAVHGVPDVTAIRFDWAAVSRRASSGVRPLTTDAEVRVALALTSAPSLPSEVAARSGLSSDYVRRAVLPLMIEAGWVSRHKDGRLARARDALWVSKRIVTVEAKLRDWSRAIGQARRQQLSADAAYVALELATVLFIADSLPRIADGGIGVIGVDAASGRARVLVRPGRLPRERSIVGRMLIAERCLAMWERGERSGQVYPVFGWTHPSESGK